MGASYRPATARMTPPYLDREHVEATPSQPPADAPPERSDEDILTELRERRTYATRAWADRREEGRKDVMCVAGDVWEAMDPDGLRQRQAAVRPALAPDEIGQYLNQTGNDVRQNKRSIRATPIGNGADKRTAEFIQGRIRQMEYRSNAQREVYSPIFEDALQRSYGFGRFVAQRVSDTSRNMELRIEAFPNPDVALVDPDGAMLSPDCSKIEWAFILDASRTRKMFKREFGDTAEVVDFTDDHVKIAPDWFQGEHVTLAEYWIIEKVRRRVVFLKSNPARGIFAHTIPVDVPDHAIDFEQWVDVPYVCQYLTNGVELLAKKGGKKRTPWPGKSIPIFSCFGKALYVQNGAGTQARLLSMVRPMRPPVMYYSYIRTCEAEVVGGVPRTNYVGYEGQFRGHEQTWQKMNHEPVPYVEAKPFTEATGNTLLPLPQRQNWDPPLQNLDMLAESARRMIQAAAGTSPLPTEAQRVNQKSGKALDRIEASGQKGSYHFVDHLDGMITRVGQMAAELIPFYDDTMGEVTVRNFKDEPVQQKINDPKDPESVMVSSDHLHDITISVGPYEADEREASSNFADSIIENAPIMQMVGPQKAQKMIASAIRLKAVGPEGDVMAEIVDPKPPEPGQPPTPEQLQQAQSEMQGLQQQNQQLQQAIETDQAKQQAHVEAARVKAEADSVTAAADGELKWRIAQLEAETELEKVRIQEATKLQLAEYELRKAEIQAEIDARQAALGVVQQRESHAHEAEQADRGRAFDASESERQREAAERQQATGHEQALESAEHAVAIQPEVEA
jgi:hypothetical protein